MERALKYFRKRCNDLSMCLSISPDKEKLKQVIEYNKKAAEALEKQTAKKINNMSVVKTFPMSVHGDCPVCGSKNLSSADTDYCNNCGQKLDWSYES